MYRRYLHFACWPVSLEYVPNSLVAYLRISNRRETLYLWPDFVVCRPTPEYWLLHTAFSRVSLVGSTGAVYCVQSDAVVHLCPALFHGDITSDGLYSTREEHHTSLGACRWI